MNDGPEMVGATPGGVIGGALCIGGAEWLGPVVGPVIPRIAVASIPIPPTAGPFIGPALPDTAELVIDRAARSAETSSSIEENRAFGSYAIARRTTDAIASLTSGRRQLSGCGRAAGNSPEPSGTASRGCTRPKISYARTPHAN